MKKFFLTSLTIVGLGLYSFIYRHGQPASVLPPVSLKQSASPNLSPTPTPGLGTSPAPTSSPSAAYKDGVYTGSPANAFYVTIQVTATIENGQLTTVKFLQYPDDRPNSISVNDQAMPYLQQEAIQAQSAQVDIVTGATDTSQAFIQSLSSALAQAK